MSLALLSNFKMENEIVNGDSMPFGSVCICRQTGHALVIVLHLWLKSHECITLVSLFFMLAAFQLLLFSTSSLEEGLDWCLQFTAVKRLKLPMVQCNSLHISLLRLLIFRESQTTHQTLTETAKSYLSLVLWNVICQYVLSFNKDKIY